MFLQMRAPCRGGLEIGATLRGDNLIKMKHIIPIYGIDEFIVWVCMPLVYSHIDNSTDLGRLNATPGYAAWMRDGSSSNSATKRDGPPASN